ncbi:MAG: hypothetical protein D3904_02810 [Candidatus Electrothrix sp. EH2]|nr:hypothetical protein [Candidatus Electrothrix sp. EH2]
MRNHVLLISFCIYVIFFSGCSYIDPREVDIDISADSSVPEMKQTELNEALRSLGIMAEIYGVKARIMVDRINDKTGTAEHTKAEIPYDVTEMTATALNSIGKNISFIPYRPDIMLNLKNLEYQTFSNKLNPSAIITGGITEFDRGLETREDSANLGYETDEFGQETPVGIEYMQGKKTSAARITVDYNVIDVRTMSGLSQVQTTNTILVHKGIGKKELGFTLFGPTLGLKGEVKKVEGRHAALRLLVQISVIQLVGRYLDLPYWRLLPGTAPDPVIESYVNRRWKYKMNKTMRIYKVQELLFLHGYDNISISGQLDQATNEAIGRFFKKTKQVQCNCLVWAIDFDLYSKLYYTLPLDEKALQRRYLLILKKNQEKIKIQQEQARLQAKQQEQAKLQAKQQEQAKLQAKQQEQAKLQAKQQEQAKLQAKQQEQAKLQARQQEQARLQTRRQPIQGQTRLQTRRQQIQKQAKSQTGQQQTTNLQTKQQQQMQGQTRLQTKQQPENR